MGSWGGWVDFVVRASTVALVAGLLARVGGAAAGAGWWVPAGDSLTQAGILGLVSVPVAELVLVAKKFAGRKQKGYAALTVLLGLLLGAVAAASLRKGG